MAFLITRLTPYQPTGCLIAPQRLEPRGMASGLPRGFGLVSLGCPDAVLEVRDRTALGTCACLPQKHNGLGSKGGEYTG